MPRISVQRMLSVMACVALCLSNTSAGQVRRPQKKTKPVDQGPIGKGPAGVTKSQPNPMPLHFVASGITPQVAQDKNTIYVVFASSNKIWLVTSGDGIVWTIPQPVSGTDLAVSDPAILMTDNGTRIITWKTGTSLKYSFSNPCQSQNGSVKFTDYVVNYDIAKTGNQVHLVIEDPSSIRYASFLYDQPPAAITETVEVIPLCGGNSTLNHPAIAARSTPSGPEVVVAYYAYLQQQSSCITSSTAGVYVVKRTSPFNWTGIFSFSNQFVQNLVTPTQPYSLSLDVDNGGVYYLAAANIVNSVSRVTLARGRVSSNWNKNTTTYTADLSKAISVSAKRNSPGYFNSAFAWLHLPPPPLNYNETSKQVGVWPLTSPAPVWATPLLLDASGKNARATDISVCNLGKLCVVSSIFERKVGNNNPEIMSDAFCVSSPCPVFLAPCAAVS